MSALAVTPPLLHHGFREYRLVRMYSPTSPQPTPADIVHADYPGGCEIDHLELASGRDLSRAAAQRLLHRCVTFLAHRMDRRPEDVLAYLMYANECDAAALPTLVRRFGRLRSVRGMNFDAGEFARYLRSEPQERALCLRVAGRGLEDWLREDARIQNSAALAAVAGFEDVNDLYEAFSDGRPGGGLEPREVLLAYYTMRCLSLDAVDLVTARNFGKRERGLTFGERRLVAVLYGTEAGARLSNLRLGCERDSARLTYGSPAARASAVITRPRLRGARGALADLTAAAEFVRGVGLFLYADVSGPLRLRTGTSLRCSVDATGVPADARANGAARIEAIVRDYVTAVERVRALRRNSLAVSDSAPISIT